VVKKTQQSGIAHILVLLAVVGLIAFIFVSRSADFKDKLFGSIFPKPSSHASSLLDNPMDVNVLVLRYFPVDSSGNLDLNIVEPNGFPYLPNLAGARDWVTKIDQQGVVGLTNGTKYHGNKNASAIPYLNYKIYADKEFLIPFAPFSTSVPSQPDYNKVLTTDLKTQGGVDICDYVDNHGVSQVWLWGYHTSKIYPVESDMAMGRESSAYWGNPVYGDVSNSSRGNDMPTCNKTYVLYNYNFKAGLGNFLEDHGHQMESLMGWVDERDNLWNNFQVPHGLTDGTVNHCGWTHSPPNVTDNNQYYWNSPTIVKSDCENWRPEGGGVVNEQTSCATWYQGTCLDNGGSEFKVWWMQQIPGYGNNLPFNGSVLRNWWEFYGNFDEAVKLGRSLVKTSTVVTPQPSVTPVPTPQPITQGPYKGTPISLPGKVEVENYDFGGEGVAYHDVDSGNNGGAYRNDGVDIQPTNDILGGYLTGWMSAGEWLTYSTNVTNSGNYDIQVRVASPGVGGDFHIEFNGQNVGTLSVPVTSGWDTWQTIILPNIPLTAGPQTMKLVMDRDGSIGWVGNINWVSITAATTPTPAPSVIPTPTPIPTIAPTPTPISTPNPVINSDTIPPVVSINYPTNGALVSGKINIQANATDNFQVSKVEFYIGNNLKCTDTIAPYNCTWQVAGKKGTNFNIQAKAYDSSGNSNSNTINVKSN
jgi:hypothetical protein